VKPGINHPQSEHLDRVTLVCYGFVILHNCVLAARQPRAEADCEVVAEFG